MPANLPRLRLTPRTGYVPVENARLYYRDIGQGRPIIILHGGPDFNHDYFLPDLAWKRMLPTIVIIFGQRCDSQSIWKALFSVSE